MPVVCPSVEEGETESERATGFGRRRYGSGYFQFAGRPPSRANEGTGKEAAMAEFAQGRRRSWWQPPSLKWGRDVPNATVMVVEDADRLVSASFTSCGAGGPGTGQELLHPPVQQPQSGHPGQAEGSVQNGGRLPHCRGGFAAPGTGGLFSATGSNGLPTLPTPTFHGCEPPAASSGGSALWIDRHGDADTPEAACPGPGGACSGTGLWRGIEWTDTQARATNLRDMSCIGADAVSHCWSLGTEGRSSERYAYASGEKKAKLCGYCKVCVLLFGKLKFLLTPGGVFAIINCFILACGRNVPANEKKAKFGPTDGTVCRLVGPGAGRDAGPLADLAPSCKTPVGRGGLWEGAVYGGDGCRQSGHAPHCPWSGCRTPWWPWRRPGSWICRNCFLWISMWHGLRTALLPANWTACT